MREKILLAIDKNSKLSASDLSIMRELAKKSEEHFKTVGR